MNNEARRVPSSYLKKDVYALDAIQGIPNYNPVNQDVDTQTLLSLKQAMENLQRDEVQKEGDLKEARDKAAKAERAFHEAMLTAKDQVRGQFGISSDQYQRLGLKKKSEYNYGRGTTKK